MQGGQTCIWGPWVLSLPFQALMPGSKTNEQDQPTHPVPQCVRPQLWDPSSTPLPKPFLSELMESNFLSFREQR